MAAQSTYNAEGRRLPSTAWKPGQSGNPGGLGATEKVILAREAIAKFVDGNAHRLGGWLDRIADDNPRAAFDAFMSVVEYNIPKLQRQELTGKDGGPLEFSIATRLQAAESALLRAGDIDQLPSANFQQLPQNNSLMLPNAELPMPETAQNMLVDSGNCIKTTTAGNQQFDNCTKPAVLPTNLYPNTVREGAADDV